MPLKFTSKEKRDELAERLATLSQRMIRSWDQGHDGKITVTDEMIGDIQTAAAVVGLAEIEPTDELPPDRPYDPSRDPTKAGANGGY